MILDRRHLDSVVLVSTIPPSCVLADSLNTHLKVTVQKSTMSSHTTASTPPTACITMVTDQRSDDCSEITSTVADDVTNSPQPHPTGKDEQHDGVIEMTLSTAICSEKVCSKVDDVIECARGEEQQCSNTSTLTTTSLTTSVTSSSSPLACNNSVSSSVSRPKPKKSLETVINLLKRPVFSDSSILSQSVVDRVLSTLSSDTRLSIQSDVTAGSKPVTSLNHSQLQQQQSPMTTPLHSLSLSNGNRSMIVDELSPSIKRLRNMCNNMVPGNATTWQPEMVPAASQPNIPATQPLCRTSFYQPTLMNGSWICSSERFNQSAPTCLELKTNDRKQQQLSARQPAPLLARTASKEPALGYQFNHVVTGQKHFNDVDWRLHSRD